MQALSIWPLGGDLLEVPQLESQLGFGCIGSSITRRRRKELGVFYSIVHLRRSTSVFARHSSGSEFDLGVGVLSGCSKLRLFHSGKSRSPVGSCFPVGWALEEQGIGNGVSDEGLEGNDRCLNETRLVNDGDELDLGKSVSGIIDFGGEISVEEGTDGCFNGTRLENDGDELNLGKSISGGDDGGEIRDEGKKMERRVDVRGLAQRLIDAKSVEDVEEVMKGEGKVPLQVFSSIIRGFGREQKLEPAMAVVNWLKTKCGESEDVDCPNLFIYNSLLGAVKQSGKLDKVDIVLNAMDETGISWNVVTYNTLMGIYLDQGRTAEALKLFDDIQHKGLSPSSASYSTALLAYRRMEDGIGALNFYLDVKDKYMNGELQKDDCENWEYELLKLKNFTSRICYQVMRRWLVKNGNFTTNVLKLLIEMDKAALPPTHEEYERLVWACTREEHYTVSKELYNRIRENHFNISLSVCNHIIWLMGKAKKWWAALEIYEDLLDKGPKPNNMSYELIVSHFNVLLGAARKRGIWRWGLRLLDKMESKGLKPGTKEWNSVLIACSKASESTAAIEIFKRMIERGEKPTVVSYGALLSALEKGKLYDEAIRVWEHMRKVGVEPNLYAYTIMASVYVGVDKFDLVDYIIQEMVSTGNNPTVITFNAIISVCTKNGLAGAAYEWFQHMEKMNIVPNEITYDTLIEALAKDGKPRLAYDLYLRALDEGLKPSAKVYDALLQSSRTFSATINIDALGLRPPEKNKKKVQTRKNLSDFGTVADVPSQSSSFVREEMYAQEAANDS